jgi:uncharacterized protein YhaN
MRQWLSGFEKLCFHIRETEKAAAETEEKQRDRRDLRYTLIAQMREAGENQDLTGYELAPVLMHAEALLDRMKNNEAGQEKLENRIGDLEESLRTAGSERRSAQENLNEWQAGWEKALSPLGLGPEAAPLEVIEFIDTLQSCLDQLKAAGDQQKRIDGIDRDNQAFPKGGRAPGKPGCSGSRKNGRGSGCFRASGRAQQGAAGPGDLEAVHRRD